MIHHRRQLVDALRIRSTWLLGADVDVENKYSLQDLEVKKLSTIFLLGAPLTEH